MKYLDLPNNELLTRIEEDIEFLNLLSNPYYIEFLIENLFFEDENFLAYLKYLQYLKNEKMMKFIKYPVCLKMLENLQNLKFVEFWKTQKSVYTNFVKDQIFANSVHLTELQNQKLESN